MRQLQFNIEIKANTKTVWYALWDYDKYPRWTCEFCEGSYAESKSNWKKGTKIHFLETYGSGVYSIIEEKIDYQEMSFRHIGEIKNFKEQPLDTKTELWSGCIEKYILQENNGITTLSVFIDTLDEFASFFEEKMPKALLKVKQLSENMTITVYMAVLVVKPAVWDIFTDTEHIMRWHHTNDNWHTTRATNDLRVGGKFLYRMEAKDGSLGFDFEGTYTEVKKYKTIAYVMPDKRTVTVDFSVKYNKTFVTETFQPESENPLDLQRDERQAILDNFLMYVGTYKFEGWVPPKEEEEDL